MSGSQRAMTEEVPFKVTFQTPFSNPETLSMHGSTTTCFLGAKEDSHSENSN